MGPKIHAKIANHRLKPVAQESIHGPLAHPRRSKSSVLPGVGARHGVPLQWPATVDFRGSADRVPLFSREHTSFAEQVGVEFEGYVGLHIRPFRVAR